MDIWEIMTNNKNDEQPNYVKSVESFTQLLYEVCAEKGVDSNLELVRTYSENNENIYYRIWYDRHKDITHPYIEIKWKMPYENITFRIANNMKKFNRRLNLNNLSKWRKPIETVIDQLDEQSKKYIEIKSMIATKIDQIKPTVHYEKISKHGNTWQVILTKSYNSDTTHSIIIQYDSSSQEFLFQERHLNADDTFKLLQTTVGE